MLKANDKLHGFTVEYLQEIEEIDGTLVRMRYDKNGADLIWIKRDDDNKSFGIGFKTVPQDDTGVFHILEHSVLCGSDKYPCKEPFVDLLKSSLQTFLNAMTYPDKTVYPLSSRNGKDFLNLIDVYMDAVLHPLILRDKHAFLQEGWHYELENEDAPLTRNGVVYNEMKGAYTSGDTRLYFEINRALFPDNCYSMESGGYPEAIPGLTYEDYIASYKRFYHPSNSRIFLDGDMDIDAVLEKLDSFLRDFDYLEVNSDIAYQAPVCPPERVGTYEIGPEEDEKDKILMADAWVFGNYDDLLGLQAANIISSYLCGTNDSPLKKAILSAGLAQDVSIDALNSQQQLPLMISYRNVSDEGADKIRAVTEDVLKKCVSEGLDKARIEAIINNAEFKAKEKDFGGMPKGLIYGLGAFDTWLYGGDPAEGIKIEDSFKALREMLTNGGFERFIKERILENKHHACARLYPSKTVGEEKRAADEAELAKIKAGWDGETIRRCIEDFGELRERQGAPDSEEARATLPRLALSDIPEDIRTTPQIVTKNGGNTILHQPLDTNGIVYTEIYFDLSDMPQEKLGEMSLAASLLGNTATENYSPEELRSHIEDKLGRFGAVAAITAKGDGVKDCITMLSVTVSALESKLDDELEIIKEVLYGTSFADTGYIGNIIRQMKLGAEQSAMMSGHSLGITRAMAQISVKGAALDACAGIGKIRTLQSLDKRFDREGAEICAGFKALCKKYLTRERALISVTGPMPENYIEKLLNTLSSDPAGMEEKAVYKRLPRRSEGFIIPADIAYAVRTGLMDSPNAVYDGAYCVASQILSYGYLWNTIRVKGGAYGTGYNVRQDGSGFFYSYRDPSAAASLENYKGAADALRELADSGENIDGYIISAVGESDPLMTPRSEGALATLKYIAGKTDEDTLRKRREILRTDAAALRRTADALDKMCNDSAICVIGGKSAVESCGLDSVETLQI